MLKLMRATKNGDNVHKHLREQNVVYIKNALTDKHKEKHVYSNLNTHVVGVHLRLRFLWFHSLGN